jgi:hypothetical protein
VVGGGRSVSCARGSVFRPYVEFTKGSTPAGAVPRLGLVDAGLRTLGVLTSSGGSRPKPATGRLMLSGRLVPRRGIEAKLMGLRNVRMFCVRPPSHQVPSLLSFPDASSDKARWSLQRRRHRGYRCCLWIAKRLWTLFDTEFF